MENPKKQNDAGEIADQQESKTELNASELEAVAGGTSIGEITVPSRANVSSPN